MALRGPETSFPKLHPVEPVTIMAWTDSDLASHSCPINFTISVVRSPASRHHGLSNMAAMEGLW